MCAGLLYYQGVSPLPQMKMHFADEKADYSTGKEDLRRLFGKKNAEHRMQEFRIFLHINDVTDSRQVKEMADHQLGKGGDGVN